MCSEVVGCWLVIVNDGVVFPIVDASEHSTLIDRFFSPPLSVLFTDQFTLNLPSPLRLAARSLAFLLACLWSQILNERTIWLSNFIYSTALIKCPVAIALKLFSITFVYIRFFHTSSFFAFGWSRPKCSLKRACLSSSSHRVLCCHSRLCVGDLIRAKHGGRQTRESSFSYSAGSQTNAIKLIDANFYDIRP